MNRDEILQKNRQENEGKHDEREMAALGTAARVGMLVGGILCALLILASEFIFNKHEIGLVAWMVYFAMQGSHSVALYSKLKERKKIVYGIIELITAVVFAVTLVVVTLG